MIGKLKGKVIYTNESQLILDVSGVGYLVSCSLEVLKKSDIEQQIELWIYTQVKESEITLFGFDSIDEKNCFENLITVQGVGGKVALAILAHLPPGSLIEALIKEDAQVFKAISGIGPKLAARIVNELKNKQFTKSISVHSSNSIHKLSNSDNTIIQEAVSALANLGFNKQSALTAVTASLNKFDKENFELEDLIRESLKIIS